jgi:hypothetical protein
VGRDMGYKEYKEYEEYKEGNGRDREQKNSGIV